MERLIQLYLYGLYVLDMMYITWTIRVIKFFIWQSWYKVHTVNGTHPSYSACVIINYFYLVNDNHTITQFRQYDPSETICKFTICDHRVDIKEGTMDGQDVFLDDISLV